MYKNNLKQLWFINCVCFITALHYSWGNTARLSVWIQSLWTFSVLFFFSDQRLLFAFFLFVIVILTWIQCQNVWRAYVVLCSLLDAADTNGSVLFCSLHCKELHYIIRKDMAINLKPSFLYYFFFKIRMPMENTVADRNWI